MNELKHLLFLTQIEGLGAVRTKRLIDKFGSAENVFSAEPAEIAEIENISGKSALAILEAYSRFNDFDSVFDEFIAKAEKLHISILPLSSPDYPDLLKRIYDPPVILYIRGNYSPEKLANSIGIVGTRKPTDYGKKMSERFAEELSSAGIAVISGFARGVDTHAHKAVLKNTKAAAITAAVFGCGVDMIYPPENKSLYDEMLEKGLLISEYEISAFPDAVNFPKRNRIISGLSFGTIVIESDVDGGALITARTALDQSREVFAVPGYITSKVSSGTNALIKNGQAKLVENLDDILVELTGKLNGLKLNSANGNSIKVNEIPELNGNEKLVYDTFLMNLEPIHIDFISEKSGLNISDSLVTLLNMEFKGIVEQLPGKRFKISYQ
ncbi:MAG TPA: DNA-processing protein DprA [Ignavibacteria bacterium]|nr:DNA-protecting protein DprA [Bacteroidota bacterium]HRE09935.1 DNA-processing protein DprA [Ignavibacteria bacterium]HRF66377.1 DNA-processing protein DprA [Ignavibacteria bacterium]HRJ05481.1 DNA-processing protein DprA [Ignavibacteria bacterium]